MTPPTRPRRRQQQSPLRIAVLECDEPIGRTKERYGGYGNLFKELLENGAKELVKEEEEGEGEGGEGDPLELDITKYDVVNHEVYPKLGDVDAVLLTGSRYDSFDNAPWILKLVDFTRSVLASSSDSTPPSSSHEAQPQRSVRLIGVCFGHQIIGRAMGARVDRSDKGWELSVTKVDLTQKGREIFGMEELAIHQMHRDIVYDYPDGTTPLGHSDRCAVQGMYEPKRLLTVQGHPEFNGDIVDELLVSRHERGILTDDLYQDAMRRVRRHHDGVAVGAAFVRFALER